MFAKFLYLVPRNRPYARSFAMPLLRRTPSQPPVSIGSRNTTIPALAASWMIRSARAKYAGFGVERSPGVVKGLMPSSVAPSSRQPVYFAQRRSTKRALKPASLSVFDVRGGVLQAQVPDHRLRGVADDHERHVALIDEVTMIRREFERVDEPRVRGCGRPMFGLASASPSPVDSCAAEGDAAATRSLEGITIAIHATLNSRRVKTVSAAHSSSTPVST